MGWGVCVSLSRNCESGEFIYRHDCCLDYQLCDQASLQDLSLRFSHSVHGVEIIYVTQARVRGYAYTRARTHLLVDPARVDGDDVLKEWEVHVKTFVLFVHSPYYLH